MLPSEYIQKGWCKIYAASDSSGNPVDPWAGNAASWCIVGAIYAAMREDSITEEEGRKIAAYFGAGGLAWNDAQESAEPIIAMLRAAEKAVL